MNVVIIEIKGIRRTERRWWENEKKRELKRYKKYKWRRNVERRAVYYVQRYICSNIIFFKQPYFFATFPHPVVTLKGNFKK